MGRTPPKSRRTRDNCPHDHDRRPEPAAQRDDREARGVPGHMGGQFEDAGYSSGRGQFGFRHDVTP